MTTPLHAFRSPAIQSIKVRSLPKQSILVVTRDPALMNTVRELLDQEEIKGGSMIWLTSVASACGRLERGEASMVVVDADAANDEGLNALYAASPAVRVRVMTDETAPRRFA